MAQTILILRTPPGPPAREGRVSPGTYSALYLYEIDPPILDSARRLVAPTPLRDLVQMIGQPEIDRHLATEEVDAIETGAMAWEYECGSCRVVRLEPGGDKTLESVDEIFVRLARGFSAKRKRAIAGWRLEHEHAGRRLRVGGERHVE